MSDLPILYSFRRCPYAMRARIGLLEANIKVELREIVLRDKPAHMCQISPKATVPVLLLPNGTLIDESLDILLWALNQNDPNNLLAADKNITNKLIEQTDGTKSSHFKHHLDRYKYASRHAVENPRVSEQATALTARKDSETYIQTLESLLANNPFLLADKPTLADYAIAPFIRQFANSGREWWNAAPYPNTQKWLEAFIASPTFQTIFQKFPLWKDGDPPIHFPT
ncbi:MAG: glutathione S-transferase [Alphaproteobacteria bacterium]|nr:glutathione S-transferase [Alphaproteobacteria bacterium]